MTGAAHYAPADRMLLAVAQLGNIPRVTNDRRIIEYAAVYGGTPVIDTRPLIDDRFSSTMLIPSTDCLGAAGVGAASGRSSTCH